MKKLLLVVLAAIATVATAASASTAAAGGRSSTTASAGCGFASVFDPISVVTGGRSAPTTARGPFKEPDLRAGPADSEITDGDNEPPDPRFQATIPVYIHVILGDGGVGDVTDAQILQQVVELNRGFAGFYDTVTDPHTQGGRTDSGFRFGLVAVTRTQNQAWWLAEPGTPEELAMKTTLRQGDGTALNLYVTSGAADQLLGWAYFPKILKKKKNAVLDGVVVHYGSLPNGIIPNFNLGFTAVHETGHWLGLYHTFDPEPRGCRGKGDRIDDTPAMEVPTSGCPIGKDTCPAPGLDPIHNYMDYSVDSCYTEFTEGQSDRMQRQYRHWRVKRSSL